MPSSITHTYFGMDVYSKINTSSKNSIKKSLEYYKVFCQGSDIFYFYNLFIGKKHKIIKEIGSNIHNNNTKIFFVNLIKYIIDNNLYKDHQVMAFLYGYMCHYFLDSTVHPFVFYKTGVFDYKNKYTYKYNSLHVDMEFYIDRYLLSKREKIDPSKYKIHKMFLNVNSFNNNLTNCINYIYSDLYKNISSIYLDSIKDMRLFFYIFNYDRFGIKKNIYSIIDYITPKYITKVKELSYRGNYDKDNNYLNINHNIWYHPCDKNISYNYSFFDLYDIALDKCVKSINMVNDMIYSKKINTKILNNIFKNLSYSTGIDCDSKLVMKYFEF